MSLTVTLDESTAERAKVLAEQRRVSVEQLVADLLALAQIEGERPGDAFARLADAFPGKSEPGWKFDRDECWERVRRRR